MRLLPCFQIINDTTVQGMLHISKADSRRFAEYTVESSNPIGSSYGKIRLLKGR